MAVIQTNTGLPQSENRRWHFDIYAVLEGPQELYFGHETQVNVNMVETVRIDTGHLDEDAGSLVTEKCYVSPTKRRGVERRTLIWAPLADGRLLGDKLGCGIPHTCTQPDCPICAVYGGLITSDVEVEAGVPGAPKRKATTLIGRLVHGGGVAVQAIEPSEKQRAMHPSMLHKEPGVEPTPMPFKRQYNEPALLYPIYNHAMSVSDAEFSAVAYAFLESLARLGAGNPKGVRLYEAEILRAQQPLLVVDRYLTPLGKRPIISPMIVETEMAIEQFVAAALEVHGQIRTESKIEHLEGNLAVFTRWVGQAALMQLQTCALEFAKTYLT
jgi:hypothetical protein